jgi:hypothetical protein
MASNKTFSSLRLEFSRSRANKTQITNDQLSKETKWPFHRCRLGGEIESKETPGRPMCRWVDNIEMGLIQIGRKGVN